MAMKRKAKAKPKARAKAKPRARAKAKARPAAKRKMAAKAKPKNKAKRTKKQIGKGWTAVEIKDLRAEYKTKPASAIAKIMRRSLASVRGKISALGLKKGRVKTAKPKAKRKARRR